MVKSQFPAEDFLEDTMSITRLLTDKSTLKKDMVVYAEGLRDALRSIQDEQVGSTEYAYEVANNVENY